MSDVIGELKRDLEERLKEVERQLDAAQPLVRKRERLQATYNTLAKLVAQGRLTKTELPGGQTGYGPAAGAPAGG